MTVFRRFFQSKVECSDASLSVRGKRAIEPKLSASPSLLTLLSNWRKFTILNRTLWRNRVVVSSRVRYRLLRRAWQLIVQIFSKCQNRSNQNQVLLSDHLKLAAFRRRRSVLEEWLLFTNFSKTMTIAYERTESIVFSTILRTVFFEMQRLSQSAKTERILNFRAKSFRGRYISKIFMKEWKAFVSRKNYLKSLSNLAGPLIQKKFSLRRLQNEIPFLKFENRLNENCAIFKKQRFFEKIQNFVFSQKITKMRKIFIKKIFSDWRNFKNQRISELRIAGFILLTRKSLITRNFFSVFLDLYLKAKKADKFRRLNLAEKSFESLRAALRESRQIFAFVIWRLVSWKKKREFNIKMMRRIWLNLRSFASAERLADGRKSELKTKLVIMRKKFNLIFWRIAVRRLFAARTFHERLTGINTFRKWREITRIKFKERRVNCIIKRRQEERTKLRNFHSWMNLFLGLKMALNLKNVKKIQLIHQWLIETKKRKRNRSFFKQAERAQRKRALSASIQGFVENLCERRSAREIFYFSLCRSFARKIWRAWTLEGRPAVQAEKVKEALAFRTYDNQLNIKVINGLRWNVAKRKWSRQRNLIAGRRIFALKCHQAISQLFTFARLKKSAKSKLNDLTMNLNSKISPLLKKQVLDIWRGPVMEICRLRKNTEMKIFKFKLNTSFKIFKSGCLELQKKRIDRAFIEGKSLNFRIQKWLEIWRIGAAINLQERVANHKAMNLRTTTLQGDAFSSWKTWAHLKTAKSKVIFNYKNKLEAKTLKTVFQAFLYEVHQRCNKRRKYAISDKLFDYSLKSKVIQSLNIYKASRTSKNEINIWAVESCTRRLLLNCLTNFKLIFRETRRKRLNDKAMSRSLQITELSLLVVARWKAFTKRRINERRATLKNKLKICDQPVEHSRERLSSQISRVFEDDRQLDEQRAAALWERMLKLKQEISSLKEQYNLSGG